MGVIHISEAEATRDFASVMARVRAGAEVLIENGSLAPAVLRTADPVRRTVSECLILARKHENETGKVPVLEAEFAEDVAEVLRIRKPWSPPAWE